MTQQDLEKLFSQCGKIITSRILYDTNTGQKAFFPPSFLHDRSAFFISFCANYRKVEQSFLLCSFLFELLSFDSHDFFSFCHLFLENLMTPSSSSSSSALLPFPPAVCNFIWLTSHWTLSCSCFASFIIGSVSTNLHETVNQVLVVQIIRGKNPN